jgi:hypothetical protein
MEYVIILCQLKLSNSQFSASIDDLKLFQIPNNRDDQREMKQTYKVISLTMNTPQFSKPSNLSGF